ncbi:MAG: cytochrome c oxidase assembly protein [Burkholderiales bacterium]|nr:cytochrome c oxidase assembly protein [Burkholderiales bacterium]
MFSIATLNRQMLFKLLVVTVFMFCFGYALVPAYKAICELTGLNVVTSKNEYGIRALGATKPVENNTQIDYSRTVTIEFDSNARGPFRFRPVKNFIEVHPGELNQIIYEVVNEQNQTIVAQAIPSYAPKIATQHFTKLECFCFQQQSLAPKESREMPVMFVIDPNLPKDVKTITLSYTFFEIQSAQPVVRGEVKPSKI